MPDKKTSRAARIKERIAETTAAAKDKFVPVDHGPDPRLHRHEVGHAVHVQKEAAAGSFEEAFDYEDPNSQRFLPEGMDGVIQIKTRGEVAADEALAKVLKDPSSVLAPRQKYDNGFPGDAQTRTIVDAGHELAKQEVSAAHRADWRESVRKGIGVGEDGSDPMLEGNWAADGSGLIIAGEVGDALERETQSPHAPSVGCAGCGNVPDLGNDFIGEDGSVYCASCHAKGLDKVDRG